MGTRGIYGFRKNSMDKITYKHSDSYPDCLGKNIVEFCRNTSIKEMNLIYDKIILVDEHVDPTEKQIEACKKYTDLSVSTMNTKDWYCLLRKSQGNLNAYKEGLNYMINNGEFIKDSLFCEYGYVINLDTTKLEFWKGKQKKPDPNNRYGTIKQDGYYPCKLIHQFDIANIPKNAVSIIKG